MTEKHKRTLFEKSQAGDLNPQPWMQRNDMTETKEALDKLRAINKQKSYEKISKELGVSSQTVYRWLKGRNSPSGLALEKVVEYVEKH